MTNNLDESLCMLKESGVTSLSIDLANIQIFIFVCCFTFMKLFSPLVLSLLKRLMKTTKNSSRISLEKLLKVGSFLSKLIKICQFVCQNTNYYV